MKKIVSMITLLLMCSMLFTGCASKETDKPKKPAEQPTEPVSKEELHFGSEQWNQPKLKKYQDHYYTLNIAQNSILILDENLKELPDKVLTLSETEKDGETYSWLGYSYRLDGQKVVVYHREKGPVQTYDVSYIGATDGMESYYCASSIEDLTLIQNKLYFIVLDNVQFWLTGRSDSANISIQRSEVFTYDLESKELSCLASDCNPLSIYVMDDGVYSLAKKNLVEDMFRDYDTDEAKFLVIRRGFASAGWETACELPEYRSFMGYTPSIYAQNPDIPKAIQRMGKVDNCEVCNAFAVDGLYRDASTHVMTDRYIFHIMSRPLGVTREGRYCIPYAISKANMDALLSKMDTEDAETVSYMYGVCDFESSIQDRFGEYLLDRYPLIKEGPIYNLLPHVSADGKAMLEELLASVGYRRVDYIRDLELDAFANEEYGIIYAIDADSMEVKCKVECQELITCWLGSHGTNPIALVCFDGEYAVIEVDSASFEKGEFTYQTLQSGYDLSGFGDVSAVYKKLNFVDGRLIYQADMENVWEYVPQK